jgi:hypothetical protein
MPTRRVRVPVTSTILPSHTWHHNSLLLEELFEECQTVIEWFRQVSKVKPDVERAGRGIVDLEAKVFETLEYIVSLAFEVALKGELRKNCSCLDHLGKRARGTLPFLSSHIQDRGEVLLLLAI